MIRTTSRCAASRTGRGGSLRGLRPCRARYFSYSTFRRSLIALRSRVSGQFAVSQRLEYERLLDRVVVADARRSKLGQGRITGAERPGNQLRLGEETGLEAAELKQGGDVLAADHRERVALLVPDGDAGVRGTEDCH